MNTDSRRGSEEGLNRIHTALDKKHGTKRYEMVVEKIGCLKERYKRIARRYEITVTKNDNLAMAVTWQHKKEEHHPGVYALPIT